MQPPAASPSPAAPASVELLRWQWQEVQAPCLVAAWILVASLAKIGECPYVLSPATDSPAPVPRGTGSCCAHRGEGTVGYDIPACGVRGATASRDTGHRDKWGPSSDQPSSAVL